MKNPGFRFLLSAIAATFTLCFIVIVIPPLISDASVINAFLGGFVNPYSTGYALDVICCWFVLAVWILYESKTKGIRHGWIALVSGIVPGVATGFAVYLLLKLKQEK
ncbi:DUF2834 domain-containing protein [Leptospira sp. WS92.C1]